MYKLVALVLAFLMPSLFVRAADPTLKAGDPAPQLFVGKWLNGPPIEKFEKGQIYIIECWATWCGPCKVSIPHVTELQAKYKDKGLTVIGLDVWERNLDLVEPFVKEMGAKMGYTIAIDIPEDPKIPNKGKSAAAWLAAAGKNGIPCSFIVDRDSKIAWIGHPMAMDHALTAVVAGNFDPAKEAAHEKEVTDAQAELSAAMKEKNYDKAIASLDKIEQLQPGMAVFNNQSRLRFLYLKNDAPAANAFAKKLADGPQKDDPGSLLSIAATMLSVPKPNKVDNALALTIAERGDSLKDLGAPAKRILAQAYAANGNYAKAVIAQEVVVNASSGKAKEAAQKTLDEYKVAAAAK